MNNNNSVQKQIDKINYENHIRKLLLKIENNITEILENNIKTNDLGLITLAIINRCEVKEMTNEKGVWLIQKDKKMENLYEEYKNKEVLVEPLVYSRTLINLINQII